MGPKKARTNDGVGTSTGQRRKRASSNPHGIVFKNDHQKAKYENLLSRKLLPTRYPDYSSLKKLDIDDNVRMLFNNVGWLEFMDIDCDAYESLTLEFLSSVIFYEDKINVLNPNHRLSFRFFNVDFELTLTEFCELLGFENAGAIYDSKNPATKPDHFNAQAFWAQITGQEHYAARHAKASLIHNPVFRYIHRTMACTLFGRGEAGGVRVVELFILWAMVHQQAVNTGYYLVSHLASVADHGKGLTVVGGLVTYIAEKLGLGDKLEDLDVIEGSKEIDIELMVSMHMLKPVKIQFRKKYQLLIGMQRSIILPDRSRTDTRNRGNWLYPLADRVIQVEEQVQQRVEEPAEQEGRDDPAPPNFNLESWCMRIEGEQQRQGAELQLIREDQLHHSQQMEHMNDMLQSLMQHFNINQAPMPGQP